MDWVKKNPAHVTLLVASVALIGVSAVLFMNAQGFPEKFAAASLSPSKSRKIPELNTQKIEETSKFLAAPLTWKNQTHAGLLFTSEKYYVKDGRLVEVGEGSFPDYLYPNDPSKNVPFAWLEEHGLPITEGKIVTEDSDGDGFLNGDEHREKTNPVKKDSMPAYTTRLWFQQLVEIPFRFKFQAYDGNVANPSAMEFQINTLDVRTPTQFLKIGDTIATVFKIMKFEFKEVMNESIGVKEDASELELLNTETNESVKLVLNKIVSSPNRFARVEYFWGKGIGQPPQVFDVLKPKEFVLQPQVDKRYKLIDVDKDSALIETPDGKQLKIVRYPADGQR